MSTNKSSGKVSFDWNLKARKLKERYSSLTDQDLYFEQGKMGDMITKLQNKVGKTKHELYQLITKL